MRKVRAVNLSGQRHIYNLRFFKRSLSAFEGPVGFITSRVARTVSGKLIGSFSFSQSSLKTS